MAGANCRLRATPAAETSSTRWPYAIATIHVFNFSVERSIFVASRSSRVCTLAIFVDRGTDNDVRFAYYTTQIIMKQERERERVRDWA